MNNATQLFHPRVGTLHFVGIGGIGMSGIAEILCNLGYTVQGSDVADSPNVRRLRGLGCRVEIGHRAENLVDAEGKTPAAIIVSSAIKAENPELVEARLQKVPVVRRADMLAELMRLKMAVAVGGTHGKTTTTSMVGTILEKAGVDPTVINGGIIQSYGTNTRLGAGNWIVVESDESDGSFTRLPATVAIITNMDPEHLDHYGSFEKVKQAYQEFAESVPFYGCAVLCTDHPEVQALRAKITDRPILSYGFNPQADVRAVNVREQSGGSMFDVVIAERGGNEEYKIENVFLPVVGQHNVQNSLAAISVACLLEIDPATIRDALAEFEGVKRRFTKVGEVNNITIIDDYGHHPVEIRAVLKAGRQTLTGSNGRLIAVMQPHRYSRLLSLFDDFCTCFQEADAVVVADVYAAGEAPIEGASKESLAEGIRARGHREVHVLDNADNLASMIADIAEPGDCVVCLGAGNITVWAQKLPEQLEELGKTRNEAVG